MVVGDNLILLGGATDSGNVNDVWSTSDGTNWTQLTSNSPIFSKRSRNIAIKISSTKSIMIGGTNLPPSTATFKDN